MSGRLALTGPVRSRHQPVRSLQFAIPLAPAASDANVRRDTKMSTMIRLTSSTSVRPGRLLGARQLAEVVRHLAASPADWLGRVRLNPVGRWYERIHLDDSHEVWVISWLPGQATGFHDHGGSAGAFAVVWGTLMERRVVGATTTGQVLAKPVGAGGSRAFGPRYIHDVRNAAASAVAVSVHAYSPPLSEMTRYDLTPAGLVKLDTEGAAAW
jgi:predicted metal-dependent enzyme (double-stranded beta helix superfamily)